MFNVGDKVVYGQTGVCIVIDICVKEFIKNQKREYYLLKPLGADNNIIYAPKEGGKIFMRHLLTKAEAIRVIESIPSIVDKISNMEIKKEEYIQKINNHTLEELVELTSYIYSKKQDAARLKKQLNAIDEKYMKISEKLLFGELSVSIGIPLDEILDYIKNKINK